MVQKRILDFNQNQEKVKINNKLNINGQKNFSYIKSQIEKLEWKLIPYKKQNWGIWLHHMSAYIGKLKPAIANLLITYCSNRGEIVFDPFCGVGTAPLEADLLGRIPIGNDLNPYAYAISRAKFTRAPMKDLIHWVNNQNIESRNEDLDWIEDQFLEFYDTNTLKEISFFRRRIFEDQQYFILGCMLGILHGHRPGHLSAITNLVIPYKPKTKPVYKPVKERLIAKIKRMYRDKFPMRTKGRIYNKDSRDLNFIVDNSVDAIISSPPYYDTLDYIEDNRLRLNFLGYKTEARSNLKTKLIQDRSNFLDDMEKVGLELHRILKPNSPCILILGDLHLSNKVINTAKEIEKIYTSFGFKTHGIVNDWMPENKSLPNNYKRKKLDKILILQTIKE